MCNLTRCFADVAQGKVLRTQSIKATQNQSIQILSRKIPFARSRGYRAHNSLYFSRRASTGASLEGNLETGGEQSGSSSSSERAWDHKWENEVTTFWEENNARPADIRALLKLGESRPHLRSVRQLQAALNRLTILLPDCQFCDMVLREPEFLGVSMIKATNMMLQLQQDFLGPHHSGRNVQRIFQRFPALFLQDDIPSVVDRTKAKIVALKPTLPDEFVESAIKTHPSLLFRVHLYEQLDECPFEIQNYLYQPTDGVSAKNDEYKEEWDAVNIDWDPIDWINDGYDESEDDGPSQNFGSYPSEN